MLLPQLEHIELKQEGAILIATFSRPEALNALNRATMDSLEKLINTLDSDPVAKAEIRALILTGAGEKAFVAGADIKGFDKMGHDDALAFAERGQAVFAKLELLNIPVIAAVNGFALGGGLELALACDMIVASEKARFALPECTLGLIPGFGGTVRLPRLIGTQRAMEMAMTGSMVPAEQARSFGLVNRVVPHPETLASAKELAMIIISRAPLAVGLIKKSMQAGRSLSVDDALAEEAKLFGEVFLTKDKTEGVEAFIEGRPPMFQGH